MPVEVSLVTLPFAHAWRTAWSRVAWPPAETFLGAFDVLHFTDWMYPPQRAGVRATTIHDLVPLHFPEWVTPRTRAMHSRKYANAARTCSVIFANSAFTADDTAGTLEFPRERIVVAHPGIGEEFTLEGPPAGARAVPAHRRDARAAQEPRHAGRGLRGCSTTRASPRGRRRRRLGRPAGARPARHRPARPRRATPSSRASIAVPRRSSTRRASRGSGCRSRRRWRAVHRSSPRRIRRSTRPRVTRLSAATRRARRRWRPRSARRSPGATSCASSGSPTPRTFSWARTGELFLEGYRRFA